MSEPITPPVEDLKKRAFSFYPPILNIEHNEWKLKEATWSEMLVSNTKMDLEVAIPRRYFGQAPEIEEPVMIIGLNRELEYKTGAVWPTERKVLAMPGKVAPMKRPAGQPGQEPKAPGGLKAITGMGDTGTDTRISRMILTVFGAIAFAGILVWALVEFTPAAKPALVAKDQAYLDLTRDDDYHAVVRKMGAPSEDRYKAGEGEIHYRAMTYKDRGYVIILMGAERGQVRYIGTLSHSGDRKKDWQPMHYVEFAKGATTVSMLRTLPRF
ncbi:MAG: hypothetical protein C0504_13910 [Candidatus Solibacter sp.]|nr:hypothetical protein [Candidatus Solibacter sp.]